MIILIATLMMLWRSWLGGNFMCKHFNPTRFIKLIVLFGIIALTYFLKGVELDRFRFPLTCLAMMFYWNHSIADYFGVNCTDNDDNKSPVINWILRKIYNEKDYHTFIGNCLGLFIGYTFYAFFVSVSIGNYYFLFNGLLTTLSYAFMGALFPKRDYTSYAEYLCGYFTGFMFYLCL